jgi:hypothetical protein
MDQYNWLVMEFLLQQRQQQLALPRPARPEALHHDGVRHAIANAIVRFGLRLDATASEQLKLVRATEGR